MATRSDLLTWGGAALLAFGSLLWLDQPKKAPPPAGTGTTPPPPVTPPTTAQRCTMKTPSGVQNVVSKLVVPSRFYNWSDLRPLPLNPADKPGWTTGGTTANIVPGGLPLGYQFAWIEAKVGTSPDGTTGWFVRLTNWNNIGGDWALPAVALGLASPCIAPLFLRGQLYYTY
jgi:hypothetical protein